MSMDDRVLAQIREEYRDMPGLRLTVPQACCLWQIDNATCLLLLERLVAEQCLRRTNDGAYATTSSMRPKPAKADLSASTTSRVRTARCRTPRARQLPTNHCHAVATRE